MAQFATLATSKGKQVIWPRSKYRVPSTDEVLDFIVDNGNELCKYMLHRHFGEEGLFPHSVRKLDDSDWKSLAMQMENQPSRFEESALFKLNGVPYLVGAHAKQFGRGVQLGGSAKYVKGHYDVLTIAALLQKYPASHPNVRITALHPAKVEDIDIIALQDCLGGKHEVEFPNGMRIVYRVKAVATISEGVAGFQSLMLNTDGAAYKQPRLVVHPGDEITIIDIGGLICNIIPGTITKDMKVSLNTTAAQSVKAGIKSVMSVLASGLKHKFKKIAALNTVPQALLTQAVMTKTVSISGARDLDCADVVLDAFGVLIEPLRSIYIDEFYGGVNAAAIPISGGGGHVALPYIAKTVLNHSSVLEVEQDADQMVFANIRGASKGRPLTAPVAMAVKNDD